MNPFWLQNIRRVAFFGDANIGEDNEVYQEAYKGAKLLAEKGYMVVNGGGGGVMEAATRGAEAVGGETLTITFKAEGAPGFEEEDKANQADRTVQYDNYPDRLKGLLMESDVYLLFKGGTGTVSEFGMVWVMAKIYYGHHKPFILVGDFWRPITKAMIENLWIDEKEIELLNHVDRVEEAIELIERWRGKGVRSDIMGV